MKAEPIYVAIGLRIRATRERKGLTQYELADAIGVTRPSVQMIERGAQRIHLHRIIEIAERLEVKPSSLLPPGCWS
jgi:transcriptional regulator with XRE-family HTH domain